MPLLTKPKHEHFAQLIAGGHTAGQAYVAAYGEAKGAAQSAFRLLKNAQIQGRIAELRGEISEKLLSTSIREKAFRLDALQRRWESLMQVIQERGQVLGKLNLDGYPIKATDDKPEGEDAETDEISSLPAPGAVTGLVCLDWRGKDALRAVWKVDTGLLAELRAIEEQAARELGELNPPPGGGGLNAAPVQVNVTFVSSKR